MHTKNSKYTITEYINKRTIIVQILYYYYWREEIIIRLVDKNTRCWESQSFKQPNRAEYQTTCIRSMIPHGRSRRRTRMSGTLSPSAWTKLRLWFYYCWRVRGIQQANKPEATDRLGWSAATDPYWFHHSGEGGYER